MRRFAVLIAAGLVAALFNTAGPATADGPSAYEMYGGGTLAGGALPICPPDCDAHASTTFTFATLPIVANGVLLGHPVAAVYNCPSGVTITGNTAGFSIQWNFTCNLTAGLGYQTITGSFGGAFPVFSGSFSGSDYPGAPGGHGTQTSECTGGALPLATSGSPTGNHWHITSMEFVGECTAVTAVT